MHQFRRPWSIDLGLGGIPRWHVYAIRDVAHRNFIAWPAWEERLEKGTTHLAVQAADPVNGATTADCKIGHVELFIRIRRILTPKRQHIMQPNLYVVRVVAQVFRHQLGCKAIKSGWDSRVRSKEIARARCGERHFERLPGLFHESARAFEYGESGVSFVEVTDFRVVTKFTQQPPTTDT